MRRLADLFNIDIASVHTMWVFSGSKFASIHADVAAECAERFCKTSFADIYDDYLVLFMDGPESSSDAEVLSEALSEQLPAGITCTAFTNLQNSTDVRESFLANKQHLSDAQKILPHRLHFSGEEIAFASMCRSRIDSGEEAVAQVLAPLNALRRKRGSEDLELTLSVFLLDSDLSVQTAADLLFLHKNTIKYRLRSLSDCVGFTVGQMPASYRLFEATAVRRLLKSE